MRPYITLLALVVAASPADGQQFAARTRAVARDGARARPLMTTTAVRAATPPMIDGKGEDPIWANAQRIGGFRVFDPVEDGEPTMQTEARIAYDDHNLYVLVRAFDPHPDSIMALLSRRDERTQSDYVRVIVDSYHDRRTAYEFMVNPAGVQRDIYLYNDSNEDVTWNAVWESKTSVDSLGWTAEFRIPLSQLRYNEQAQHTFGIGIHREVARLNERSSWPLWRRSEFGIASQLGEIRGLDGLASPRRLEVMPYTVQANDSKQKGGDWGRAQRMTMGGDLKYGLSSNLTLDATINPDFGQVEADPAVLNLGAFEQFFEERRPFFLEGTGIFRYDIDCNDGQCTGPFYSRRIGRSPQLGGLSNDPSAVPLNSTILGAAKVTGRLSRGLSLGILDAVTGRESVADSITVEPRTNYFVARAQQDLRGGKSGFGLVLTAVNRQLDARTDDFLRREAYTAGFDFRHRFGSGDNYQVSGQFYGSTVRGSTEAIARTQLSPVHFFQRPDDDVAFDSTRTSLSGFGSGVGLSKNGGGMLRFWTGVWYKSAGLEINDVGFMTSVNNMGQSNWVALVFQQPKFFYRRWQVNFNQWNSWLTDGLSTSHGGNINMNGQLRNMWFVYGGLGGRVSSYCSACLRGGPSLREDPATEGWAGLTGDQRRAVYPSFNAFFSRRDGGRSFSYNFGPNINARVSSAFSTTIGVNISRNRDDRQWLGNYGDVLSDTTAYTVGHLAQRTVAITSRINWTASPTLSLQVYAQPFSTGGEFSNWRRVADPRAPQYDARFEAYSAERPDGFNFKQFRSNTVLRWEYRPGSTLFFVWAQGRLQDGLDAGSFRFGRDFRNLFSAHPENTFLVKASYWFSL